MYIVESVCFCPLKKHLIVHKQPNKTHGHFKAIFMLSVVKKNIFRIKQ